MDSSAEDNITNLVSILGISRYDAQQLLQVGRQLSQTTLC